MFDLSPEPLDASRLKSAMVNPTAGAWAEFEGWVRDHNEGQHVDSLEYEAFPELAVAEGGRILAEVRAQHDILDARCVHRVGHLQIGELAVWVGVTARHRDAAFLACRAIIDAVKGRVPIWKKEHYANGAAAWVNCAACAAHGQTPNTEHRTPNAKGSTSALDVRCSVFGVSDPASESAFYRRQVALPQIGMAGQLQLKSARVLVVGAGGLGCPALQYLAAAGVGHIGICDGDAVDASNLHRQVLYDHADVGRFKAEVAAEKLRAQNPHIAVEALRERCERGQEQDRIRGCDVVLDCTDNFTSKFLIHDACFHAGVPLVQAAIHQFEGQLHVFRPASGAGCLRCLWPEAPADGCVDDCADAGVIGVVPGLLGTLQAAEALKLILGLPGVCDRETVLVDLLTLTLQRIKRDRNPRCPLCGSGQMVPPAAAPPAMPEGEWVLDVCTLTPGQLVGFEVIDIRSADEREGAPAWIQGLRHVDWRDLDAFTQLAAGRVYLLACAHGVRSRKVVGKLRKAGHANFYALRQGVEALAGLLDKA